MIRRYELVGFGTSAGGRIVIRLEDDFLVGGGSSLTFNVNER